MLILFQILILSSMCAIAAAAAAIPEAGQSHSHIQGTYWNGATLAGSCLMQTTYGDALPGGLPYVAVAQDLNANGQYCGACIKVSPLTGKRPPVIAMVSSFCPDCPAGALDIPGSLYDLLMGTAPQRPGIAKFNWEVVACPLGNRMPKIKNKEGSSKWHLSMAVFDNSHPIKSVSIKSGTQKLDAYHRDYNYWELHDAGTLEETVDVTVTCTNGRSFTVPNVDPSSTRAFDAPSQC
ncbi:hypothetical protein VP01_582g6 [Puccinia sorghi]|uniref:Expansin-like EG45 domain-containing protein n=1 Tax=Puccinia sorghi TaxID=27349 RepID=A0A0L6UIV0_9BASI|nr:hypothetical protein VP01_582g6 [Puccinia sorghi]